MTTYLTFGLTSFLWTAENPATACFPSEGVLLPGKLTIFTWTAFGLWKELAQFRQRTGILPIIAHIDRYIGPFRTRGIPERLGQTECDAELAKIIQECQDEVDEPWSAGT